MSNIKLQLYQKANDNKGTETDLQQMIETIAGRTGASANIEQKQIRIRELLKAGKDNEASELKRTLPGVTWCGTFAPTRAIKNLQQYNPFQIFDIDKLQPDDTGSYRCTDVDGNPPTSAVTYIRVLRGQYSSVKKATNGA